MKRRSASLREPRQARSQESYRRLLDAAEEIMEEKSFDEATIGELVERARLTTGAFYARFAGKEALFRHLEERTAAEFRELSRAASDPRRWKDAPSPAILENIVAGWAREYFHRRPVARALVMRSHSDPRVKNFLQRLNRENFLKLFEIISRRASIAHPDPGFAVEFVLLAIRCLLRETILFQESWPGARPLGEGVLVREVTRMILGYLAISTAAPRTASRRGFKPGAPASRRVRRRGRP